MKSWLLSSVLYLSSSLFALSCAEPQIISDPAVDAAYSKIAMNAKGEAVLCWNLVDGFAVKGLQAASRGKNSTWSLPETITEESGSLEEFRCSIDATGNQFVAWSVEPQGSDVKLLRIVQKEREDDSWSFPEEIVKAAERCFFLEYGFSQPGHIEALGRSYFSKYCLNQWRKAPFEERKIASIYSDYHYFHFPVFGVNEQGMGYALIQHYKDGLMAYRVSNGSFLPEKPPFESWDWDEDQVKTVIDGKGNAAFLVVAKGREGQERLLAVSKIDQKWEEVALLPSSERIERIQLSIDNQDNLFAVWEYGEKGTKGSFLKAAYKPYGERWEIFEDIKGEGNFQGPFALASNNQGRFVILWQAREGSCFNIQGTSFEIASRGFSEIKQLSLPGKATFLPALAFNPAGKGLVTWTTFSENLEWQVEVAEITD